MEPIDWCEIAELFQPVALPEAAPAVAGKIGTIINIFAPDVQKLDKSVWEESEEESSSDCDVDDSTIEDISDKAVRARHQKALEYMKEKLDVALEQ